MKRLICHAYGFVLCFLIVILPLSISAATDTEEEPRLPLAMKVLLKKPSPQHYVIHIHLTNISQEPVMVDVHDLPWNPPNDSKWLKALRLDTHKTPINQRSVLWDIGSQEVRLLPGESIQDKVTLNPRMPTLLPDIAQFGIQLHWDCPPSSLKFICQTDALNAITIPKGDPGQPQDIPINHQACRAREHAIGLIRIPQDHDVLFLQTTEPVVENLQHVQALLYQVDDYVQQCQPNWTNSWSVSFFTDEKYAGFLNDSKNEPYYEQGLWQQANIGQYSSQIRTLYRFPWNKKKSDTVYLSVYR
ncbi:hypothetical protein [Candidatus Nitrospira salsa]